MNVEFPHGDQWNLPEYDKATMDFCNKYKRKDMYFWHGFCKAFEGDKIPRWHCYEPIHFVRPQIHFDLDYWSQKSHAYVTWFFKIANLDYGPSIYDRYDVKQCLDAVEFCEKRGHWKTEYYNDEIGTDLDWNEFVLKAAIETGAVLTKENVVGWGWNYKK